MDHVGPELLRRVTSYSGTLPSTREVRKKNKGNVCPGYLCTKEDRATAEALPRW
jgi:hypothetical protein